MNSKIFLTIGALLVVIVAVGAFFVLSPKTGTPSLQSPSTNSNLAESSSQGLKDLLLGGKTQQCTFSDELGNQGTVYTADGKMKGDFSSTYSNQTVKSHIIADAQTAYIWNDDGTNKGLKMAFDVNAVTDEPTSGIPSAVDVNKKYNYSCSGWNAVSTSFDVPTTIEFLDIAALIKQQGEAAPVAAPEDQPVNCSICDQAPEESMAQCRQSLGCS